MQTETNHRILVIDDNPAIHSDFQKILGGGPGRASATFRAAEAALFGEPVQQSPKAEFQLDSAFQGQEGLERARQALAEGRPYAVAFVDVRMPPGWDGIETIEHLWRCDPRLQIVICTAYSDLSWADIFKRLGRSDKLVILKKPFENIEVFQLACALTEKWRLAHQLQSQLADLDQLVERRTRELAAAHAGLEAEAAERQLAVRALRSSEARFARAFDKSPLPMAIQTLEPEAWVDANERFQQMLGYPLQEMLGRTAAELELWPEPLALQMLRSTLLANEPVRLLETRLRTRSGELRDVVLAAEKFEMNGTSHALLIVQDVTRQVRLERQLRRAQKMEAVGRLATGVAHDFNNMLTIIQGHVHLLSHPADSPLSPVESLEQIASVSERASRLTRHLLEFSRKQPMRPKVLDLNTLLTRLNCLLSRLIGENIEWQCRFDQTLPLVEGDESSLEQVITQLVVNARDAMPDGGQLWIRTAAVQVDPTETARHPDARSGTFVCLSVTDTGLGMDQDTVLRVFEPFFAAKEANQNGGLGLAAAFGIIKQHRGWIEVMSEPRQGSTFNVFLPAAEGFNTLRQSAPIIRLQPAWKEGECLLAA